MKIKLTYGENHSPHWPLSFLRNRRVLYLTVFILYNTVILVIAISFFFAETSPATRQRVTDKSIAFFKNVLHSTAGDQGETLGRLEKLTFDIRPEELQMLIDDEATLRQKGFLLGSESKIVRTSLLYEDQPYAAELSVKNHLRFDRSNEGAWPLQVHLQGEQTILGMSSFSARPLSSDGEVSKWLSYKLSEKLGVISPFYDLMTLEIKDQGRHTYAVEEDLSRQPASGRLSGGAVLNFHEEAYWGKAKKGSEQAGENQLDNEAFEKVKGLMAGFLQGKRSAAEVFDVNKLANAFALMELFGSDHPGNLVNMRFYYHPESSLLEPVIDENLQLKPLHYNGIMGVEKQIGQPLTDHPRAGKGNPVDWFERVFHDRVFFEAYTKALERISTTQFLDGFFSEENDAFTLRMGSLQAEGYGYHSREREILYENQAYLRDVLKPTKLVQAYFDKDNTSAKQLYLEVSNINNLPVEIVAVQTADSIQLKPAQPPLILPGNIRLSPTPVLSARFVLPDGINWADSMLVNLMIQVRIPGANWLSGEEVLPYSRIDRELLAGDLMRQKSNVGEFAFLEVDSLQKKIRFKEGAHRLEKTLIIPKGYAVYAGEGLKIDMTGNANILSYSPLRFTGSKEAPVTFFSSDSTAQGITVLYAGEESLLQHVHFDNLSNPVQSGWSLTSAITFYESPVRIEHCWFRNNRRGDDYLNIVRTGYVIDDSDFLNTNADAFDGDFCTGIVKNTRFFNSGNDAIDVSGSVLTVENLLIDKTGDKGISIGENSRMEGHTLSIKNAEIAVTAKDLSSILIDDINIQDSRIAYTAFQKKPEFGPAKIEIRKKGTISGQTEILYLIEDKSTMTVDGQAVSSSIAIDHVKQILYGVKYGKSSQ